MSALRAAFVAASVAWAVMLPLAPYVASRPHASPAGTAFVVAVYGIGGLICHQLPERSYRLWTAQMPVCARCTGIYVGAAIAAAAAVGARRLRAFGASASLAETRARSGRPEAGGFHPPLRFGYRQPSVASRSPERLALQGARATLIIAALPTLLTLSYEWTTGHMPAHWIRAAAGVLIGAVVAWLVVRAADNRVN